MGGFLTSGAFAPSRTSQRGRVQSPEETLALTRRRIISQIPPPPPPKHPKFIPAAASDVDVRMSLGLIKLGGVFEHGAERAARAAALVFAFRRSYRVCGPRFGPRHRRRRRRRRRVDPGSTDSVLS